MPTADQKSQVNSTKANLWDYWRTVKAWLKNSPWWIVGLLSITLLCLSLAYQANAPYRLSRYQTHQPFIVTDDSSSPPRAMTLMVVYPKKLLLQEVSEPGRPIQVWLSDPISSNPSVTYTVMLEPLADGLMFTDEKGLPVTPSVVFTVPDLSIESSSWFLHRTPSIAREPKFVDLKPSVFTPDGNRLIINPSNVPIELETSWGAFWRNFLDLACGSPIIPVLGFAFTVTTWFWTKGNERREEERKREQERRERAIARVRSLLETNPTEGTQRYLDLRTTARTDQEKEELDHKCLDGGLQANVELEAIASLTRGDYGMAYSLRQVLCEKGETAKPKVCGILTHLSDPTPSSEVKMDVLIRLAAERGGLLPTMLIQRLAEHFAHTLSEEGALERIDTTILKQKGADWLLATPSVQKQMVEAEGPDGEAARRLQNWLFKEMVLPPVRPSIRRTDEPEQSIAKACNVLDWPVNPFGPDQVEHETRCLTEIGTQPPVWDALYARGPVALLSKPGAGRTFALHYLLQTHSEEWRNILDRPAGPGLFPVLLDHEMVLQSSTREEYVAEIVFAIGQALLHYLAHNYSRFDLLFERTTPPARQTISRLIQACQHRLGDLEGYIERYLAEQGPVDSVVSLWLPDSLRKAAAGAQPIVLERPAEVWFALKDMRLARSQGFVVAIDVPARLSEHYGAEWLARRLRPLIELMPDLEQCGIDLKVGLPESPGEELLSTAGSKVLRLATWTDKQLEKLLTKRLVQVQSNGFPFDGLVDPGDDPSLSKWIVQMAHGSPQRLVRLGNSLLARYGDKSPNEKLVEKDLADVVNAVP